MELFADAASYEAHKASDHLKASAQAMLALGASGSVNDLSVLETPMLTLQKVGFPSGANHVIMICCLAKDDASALKMVEVAKGEIESNLVEPTFIRGTILLPSADEPRKVRWTVQWAAKSGVAAHQTFDHHKNAGPKIFPLVSMEWGGALEYHEAYHFAK